MAQVETVSFASSELTECPATFLVVSWNIEHGQSWTPSSNFWSAQMRTSPWLREVDRNARRTSYRNIAKNGAQGLRVLYVFGGGFEELPRARMHRSRPQFSSRVQPLSIVTCSEFLVKPVLEARLVQSRHVHRQDHKGAH